MINIPILISEIKVFRLFLLVERQIVLGVIEMNYSFIARR